MKKKPPIKLIIIAGNFREYVVYITENDLDRDRCPYVYHGDQFKELKGISRDTPVLLVGSYENNPAAHWDKLFINFREVIQVNV